MRSTGSRPSSRLASVLVVLCTVAANGPARAQDFAGVDLAWRGPPSCAEPLDTLAMARGLVDPSWLAVEPITVRVSLRDLGSDALELSFEAEGADGPLRRVLQVTTCSEARRAAAVWIALSVGEQIPTERTAAALAPQQASAVATASPTPPAPASAPQPEAEPNKEPAAGEEPAPVVRADRSEVAPTRFARNGLSLAIGVGVEGPVLASVGVPFAAWLGWRATHLELDLGARVWLPAKDEVSDVSVRLDQLGAVLGACYWISFDRWELGPSAKLLVERVDAELNGENAEATAWVRAAPGLRLAVWLSTHVALQFVTDAIVSLHRPTLSSSTGDSVRTTAFNVAALGALIWKP